MVNQKGQRFYDEGEDFWPKRYAIWGRLLMQQPGQQGYAIVDSRVANSFMPSVFPPYEATSITRLAELIQVDPASLERTIVGFNEAVVSGSYDINRLDDCHTEGVLPPKSHWALPLDKPPYYAYPLRPRNHVHLPGDGGE